MSFLDEIRARAEESLNNISTDVNSYFKTRVTDAVVKLGEPPKGNLTAAQIAQGQTGAPAASQTIQPASSGFDFKKYLPFLAIGVGAYFILKAVKGK